MFGFGTSVCIYVNIIYKHSSFMTWEDILRKDIVWKTVEW